MAKSGLQTLLLGAISCIVAKHMSDVISSSRPTRWNKLCLIEQGMTATLNRQVHGHKYIYFPREVTLFQAIFVSCLGARMSHEE